MPNKPTTVLWSNYGAISDVNGGCDVLSYEAILRLEKASRLSAKLEVVECSRLASETTYTLDESKKHLGRILRGDN